MDRDDLKPLSESELLVRDVVLRVFEGWKRVVESEVGREICAKSKREHALQLRSSAHESSIDIRRAHVDLRVVVTNRQEEAVLFAELRTKIEMLSNSSWRQFSCDVFLLIGVIVVSKRTTSTMAIQFKDER